MVIQFILIQPSWFWWHSTNKYFITDNVFINH